MSHTSIPKMLGKVGMQADAEIRRVVAKAIKRCSKSREDIAEEMSKRMDQRVSVSMLNDWTAAAKRGARFPAAFIEAFCEVVGDDRLQRAVMGARLRKLAEFAEHELEKQRLGRELLRKHPKPRKRPKPHGGLHVVSARPTR